MTFDLSQTGFCKNKQIWVFLGLTKENLSLLSLQNLFMKGKYLPYVSNANICLKFFCFRTTIYDFSQAPLAKKEKIRVFWSIKNKKIHLFSENIFLPIADTCVKLSMQKMFLFSSCNSWKSQTGIIKKNPSILRPKESKNLTDAVENSFYVL